MAAPGVIGLSPAALEELLESGSITLVDVRERVEHWLGSIPGSRLAPLSSLPVEELAAEAEQIRPLLPVREPVGGGRGPDLGLRWGRHPTPRRRRSGLDRLGPDVIALRRRGLGRGLIAAALGALAIGLALGFLGSGGSILAVPVLIYLLGQEEKVAIAGSLAVVGAVAAAGALDSALRRSVDWRAAALFGSAGFVGSSLGALLGAHSAGATQMALFGCVLIAAAAAMAFRRVPLPVSRGADEEHPKSPRPPRSPAKMLLDGLLVGALTGYVGVGGGFAIVPALTLLGGLPMQLATGTSLVVIAANAGSGFAWHLALRPQLAGVLDWPVLGAIALVGMAGSLAGRRLARRFEDRVLRRAFALALFVLAIVVLRDALPRIFGGASG